MLIAAVRTRDASHVKAAEALESCAGERLAVPVTILAETMGFLARRDGLHHQRRFWDGFMESGIRLLPVDASLVAAARDIDRLYADAGFGFADCVLLASCESHRCQRVLSLDVRLAAYRPSFATGLELIP